MQINSINTNLAAFSAQTNIRTAQSDNTASVARLSSGNKITQASDDVAGLSIGTSLATNVSTLRTALVNASQGISLLSVADSALNQITEILQRQKAIAVQAGSGTLGNTERAFLDAEFQALVSEIDRIASNTNFNGVNLINGGLSSLAELNSTTSNASKGALSVTFNNTISLGETITIGGQTLTAATSSSGLNFQVGSSIGETIDNLAQQLNTLAGTAAYSSTLGEATYSRSGNSLVITARAGGSLSNNFAVTQGNGTATTVAIRALSSNPQTTGVEGALFTQNDATVTVTKTAHGFTTGDRVIIGTGATGATEIVGAAVTNDLTNSELLGSRVVTVVDANTFTYEADDIARGITLANDSLSVTDSDATVTVTISSTTGLTTGDYVLIAGATDIAGASTQQAADMNGWRQITVVNGTSFTFEADDAAAGGGGATAGGGAATTVFSATNDGATLTFNKASATSNGQATFDGGYQGSSFFLWDNSASAITSATQAISADTATAALPFDNGDAVTATINGVTKTLYTIASGDTITDFVNGVNANSEDTGVNATLILTTSGTYNVRFDYEGLANNVQLNVGANYNSTTYTLAGQEVTTAGVAVGTDGLTVGTNDYIANYYTSYIDVLTATTAITANSTATVTATSPSAASAPFRVGDNLTININGAETVLHTFQTGEGLDDIVVAINANTASTGVQAVITSNAGGTASGLRLLVDSTNPGSDVVFVNAGAGLDSNVSLYGGSSLNTTGAALTQVTAAGLSGGTDDGLGQGNVLVSGSVGDNILAGSGSEIAQNKPSSIITLTQNATAGETITVAGQTFVFVASASAANEITLGSSISETIDNAVNTINSYLSDGSAIGNEAYILNQLNITRDDNSLVFEGKSLASVTDLSGTAATVARSITGSAISNGTLNNGSTTYGVDVTGVTNADFQGTISGFEVTYKDAADTVDISIQVGDFTYSASNVDLTVATDTAIRLYSDTVGGQSGGYFDIQLDAGNVLTFNSQAGADTIANRLDTAFSNLSFTQERNLDSYNPSGSIVSGNAIIGSLTGTSLSARLDDFSNLEATDITVTAPSGSNTDAKISIVVNGVTYSTGSDLTSKLGANQTYKLLSESDPNQFIEFTTGDTAIQLDTAAKAAAVETALKNALGFNSGSASLNFQVGTDTSDTLSISINDASTNELYAGATLDVLTSESAAIAVAAIDVAIENVTAVRAQVGAIQSRFNFAAANIESSIQNQDAARGTLLDTDIADESTAYAISQVKLQAGISVLAQANQALQSLLKLIG